MMKMMTRLIAATALCVLPVATASAAKLIVESGTLMGANGVMVAGKSYDVRFTDGTCASVYDGCDTKNFDFTSETDALAAAKALLGEVFIDSDAGNFDSRPSMVRGCGDESGCTTLIRFAAHGIVAWSNVAEARNDPGTGDAVRATHSFGSTNTSTSAGSNFARFTLSAVVPTTPVSAVPEPSSWALLLAGFALTSATMRRRRVRVSRVLA